MQELTIDRIAAEADLTRTLGTLRYLTGLRAAQTQQLQSPPTSPVSPKLKPSSAIPAKPDIDQEQSAANATPTTAGAEEAGPSGILLKQDDDDDIASLSSEAHHPELPAAEGGGTIEGLHCPVCHDVLGQELMMLTCGHQLCCRCCMTLIERLPAFPPQVRLSSRYSSQGCAASQEVPTRWHATYACHRKKGVLAYSGFRSTCISPSSLLELQTTVSNGTMQSMGMKQCKHSASHCSCAVSCCTML